MTFPRDVNQFELSSESLLREIKSSNLFLRFILFESYSKHS